MRLYPRLAAGGIRRNGKLYVPYIMTCSLMTMMFYIVNFLSDNPFLDGMKGGSMMKQMMRIGIVIMAIFAAIFLFYTFGPNGNGQARYSWFIWAIAGVLYGAVIAIVKLVNRAGK